MACVGAHRSFVRDNSLALHRRSLWFDIIIGAVSAVIGGYLSTQYLGNTAMQHFLVSILAAVFSAALMMWVVGGLIAYFRKKEE